MKEKLTRNIGLKILSVILASILWLIITNVDDPVKTEQFFNVPVEILNEDAIDALDLIYEVVEGKTIDFTVAARRSIVDELTVADFIVTADFTKLSEVNAVKINITCPRYGDEVTINTDSDNEVMKVDLEPVDEKHFKVNVVEQGKPAEGYFVGEKTSNTIIKVSGPKSKIERIKEIVVEVDVTDVSESFRIYEEPKALDEEGNEIDSSNLTFSESTIAINIGIYETKEIPLVITATGMPLSGYVMTNLEYEPKTIEVAGDDADLRNINQLTISESIEGAFKNIEKEIDLQEALVDGLILVGEDKTAVVNITIERAESKEVTIWPGDIELKNKPADINLTYITTGPIAIGITGPTEEIAEVTRTSLKPLIDLSGYSSGTYSVPISLQLPTHSSVVNELKVSVYLTR